MNTIPKNISNEAKELAEEIVVFWTNILGEEPDTGGCQTFYSPEEWRQRGEQYGIESELIIVYDGGDWSGLLNPHTSYMWKMFEELNELIESKGFYKEQCTNWFSAIYKG